MRKDALEKLRAENPLPELLPGLPVEVIRQRLDQEPPVPLPRSRRRRTVIRSRLADIAVPFLAVGVAIVVALVAIVSLHRDGHAPAGGGPGPSASGALLPVHPSGRQRKEMAYIFKAEAATERADKACAAGFRPPLLGSGSNRISDGSPPAQLLSILPVLARPATPRDKLPTHVLRPFALKDIDVRYIRRARRVFGLSIYIVPAGDANLGGPVPARCLREQSAALHRELPQIPRSLRAGTLGLEPRFVNQTRHDALPYPGVCLVALGADGGSSCSYSVSDIEQGRAITSGGGPDEVGFIYGLVPDGVATVTLSSPEPGTHGRAQTTTVKAINNVFIVPNPGGYRTFGTPAKLIWRSDTGAVIRTITP
jgi:hypothetical protein